MKNSFSLHSEDDLKIERFHICTWDFKINKSFGLIEFGMEIINSNLPESNKTRLILSIP